MNEILTHSINIAGFCLYVAAIIATVTLPIWGYKLVEAKILGKHKALRVASENRSTSFNTTSIVASIGTTTAGVFLIQVLPLVFSMINDVGGQFAVDTVYAEHLTGSGLGDYVNGFYGLTAELGGMMQTAAPMAAVGLGGYNLLNNLSRGLPAIMRPVSKRSFDVQVNQNKVATVWNERVAFGDNSDFQYKSIVKN